MTDHALILMRLWGTIVLAGAVLLAVALLSGAPN
jgi:hypothetical protein